MKHALVVASCLVALTGVLAAAPGCRTVQSTRDAFLSGSVLTYEQYLSVDQSAVPPPTAEQVIKKLGTPLAVRDRNGAVRELDYHAYALNGELATATFFFDDNQKLVKKWIL